MTSARLEVLPAEPATSPRPLLSIVVPAHNEAATIGPTLRRIAAAAAAAPELAGRVEAIVVSDGSRDRTFDVARRALAQTLRGSVVELETNAGSHAAIVCGLRHAAGDYVAIMAADGQDPPEVLPEMVRALRPDVDVVWGRRRDRSGDRRATRVLAAAYYRLFRTLTGFDYPPGGLDFLVAKRRVIEVLLAHPQRNASLFLTVFNLGFGHACVDYDRGARAGGESSWTLRKRLKLGVDMLTALSSAPIRVVSGAGVLVGLVGIVLGTVTMIRAALGDVPVAGWASLMVLMSIMGGLLLIAVGLVGEYVWRILDEVRGRPLFLEGRHTRVGGEEP
jgi:dolichol-phosphate mannosyltransferase